MACMNDRKYVSNNRLSRLRQIETCTDSPQIRAELEKLKRLVDAHPKGLNTTFKITKRKNRSNISTRPRREVLGQGLAAYFLFELASGYALFHAHGVDDLHMANFDAHEKYINCPDQTFTLKAFHPFLSTADALVQMIAISNSTVTPQLKSFLVDNLPKWIHGKGSSCFVATSNPFLAHKITSTTGLATRCGEFSFNLMRGLRMKIDKFIDGLEPKDLEKQQLNLARLYSRQREEDFVCTKNLVPGEALYGEELIYIQNEDGTDIEYRVWNPLKSKLAAAIMCGVKNICVKPGAHVLYIGDVCEITVTYLSDLVGSDGLVYVVGISDVVVNMVEKRPNVITIIEKPNLCCNYRMVLGMVDVIFANVVNPIVSPHEAHWIVNNARFYLRAGGHYMISTQANNINSTSQGILANNDFQRQFNPIELVMLEPIVRETVMAIGSYRVLEE
ncbi:hypothetical protein POM88_043312 [Heracleum sosnowskyi]|uniref:Nucleolar protein 58/56 N-terminal domain-containing protein n=1 Tax=Heracleum sosnowskyi TaxID=360622 RepID=A0AAD8H275_9APIA|nr:hypothetical protein POM88_043312 [Heracleum sosnowskyi]